MKFTKMHGCGNDYVYVDGGTESISLEKKPEIVRYLSDRHFGIGGDGVIFINPAENSDFEMEMWNADGTRSEMCGNGIRCVAKFVYDKGLTDKTTLNIESAGKVKILELTVSDKSENRGRGFVETVRVDMGEPILIPDQIPVDMIGERVVDQEIMVQGNAYKMTCVSMGNPHAIVFMKDIANFEIEKLGPFFENHKVFPKRTNTEFVEVISDNYVKMRVWERGTGETLACGTGCCATVVACVLNGKTGRDVTVEVLGGKLQISWDQATNHVFMTGPATTIFDGEISL